MALPLLQTSGLFGIDWSMVVYFAAIAIIIFAQLFMLRKYTKRRPSRFWSWGYYGIWAELDELHDEVAQLRKEIIRLKGGDPDAAATFFPPAAPAEKPPNAEIVAREKQKEQDAATNEARERDQASIVHIRCLACDRISAATKGLLPHLQNCPACQKYPFVYVAADEADFRTQQKAIAAAPPQEDPPLVPADPYQPKSTSTYRNTSAKTRDDL
ncbi:MAG: hypothetical protein IT462_13740 [Planctomycetes bacterium]|nr:hypothetical protein [Planctomycetota bacterium]